MTVKITRNKEWNRLPEEGKQKIYDNLPFPFPFVLAILLFLIYGTPYVLKLFNLNSNQWIGFSLAIVFMLYIIGYMSWSYNKKTGRYIHEDIEKIRNKYDLERKNYNKKNPKPFSVFTFIFIILWLIMGIIMIYLGSSDLFYNGVGSASILTIIFGAIISLVGMWFIIAYRKQTK